MSRINRVVMAAVAGGLLLSIATAAAAQDGTPLTRANMVFTGYGSATYEAALNNEFENNFTSSISPIFLYNMGGDVLFEAELEFGLSGEATTTTLEYAQIDYLGFEQVIITAGKFLVPFGIFGERMHPTWINKLPTAPLLFGHGHGGVAEGSLLPVLSDAGLMVRFAQPFGSGWGLNLSLYATQGPTLVDETADGGDGHDDDHGADPSGLISPAVGFGVAFDDNNKNKMIGGRLGLVKGPGFEVNFSIFNAMYDEGNYLSYNAHAVSLQWGLGGVDLMGEYVHLMQEFQSDQTFPTLITSGYYVQLSHRVGRWEPVARWSQILDATIDGEAVRPSKEALALGLDYWIDATIPVKLAYEFRPNSDDGVVLQWAFGF